MTAKRYVLFSGCNYEGLGGWYDLKHTADSIEELVDHLLDSSNEGFDWFHIVDLIESKIVKEGRLQDICPHIVTYTVMDDIHDTGFIASGMSQAPDIYCRKCDKKISDIREII